MSSSMRRRYLPALILTLTYAVCAGAQVSPVWQIGEFNKSSDEFGAQARGAFDAASGRAKDWGATQQAVVPGKGDATASRVVRFALAGEPRGAYRLRLGL